MTINDKIPVPVQPQIIPLALLDRNKRSTSPNRIAMSSRRYLGSKTALLPQIIAAAEQLPGNIGSVADIFSGTGVVANAFNRSDRKIIANDLLFSNFVSLRAWLGVRELDWEKLEQYALEFQTIEVLSENYVSQTFGGKYFDPMTARKIGRIRERIETLKLSDDEKSVLISGLLYAADRVANTCGHYDAYRQVAPSRADFRFRLPDIQEWQNPGNEIYQQDANQLIERIEGDLLFIDPPYNSRNYSDTYHVLENIARWEKPATFGVAAKMDRSHLKSKYCGRNAARTFDDLISKARFRYIMVTYNNMGNKGNSRSQALISDEDIRTSLGRRGKVEVITIKHKAFTTGKSDYSENAERLFICDVSRSPSR